jgi:hypothetical protein
MQFITTDQDQTGTAGGNLADGTLLSVAAHNAAEDACEKAHGIREEYIGGDDGWEKFILMP